MVTYTKGHVYFLETMSDVLTYFERSFQCFNQYYFNNSLPKTVVTVQSTLKSYGHASVQKIWEGTASQYYEINMSADYLDRTPEDILVTLLHEMIHIYCREEKIMEISRNGTYHNKCFKKECEKRDLLANKMEQYGWADTIATENFRLYIMDQQLMNPLPFVRMSRVKQKSDGQRKQSSRKYVCPSCQTIVRATSDVNILCGDCHQLFLKEN